MGPLLLVQSCRLQRCAHPSTPFTISRQSAQIGPRSPGQCKGWRSQPPPLCLPGPRGGDVRRRRVAFVAKTRSKTISVLTDLCARRGWGCATRSRTRPDHRHTKVAAVDSVQQGLWRAREGGGGGLRTRPGHGFPFPWAARPPGLLRLTHPRNHIRKCFRRKKIKFIKGARSWRSILGTHTFWGPLTPPPLWREANRRRQRQTTEYRGLVPTPPPPLPRILVIATGYSPVSGTAAPQSSQTGQVIRGLR